MDFVFLDFFLVEGTAALTRGFPTAVLVVLIVAVGVFTRAVALVLLPEPVALAFLTVLPFTVPALRRTPLVVLVEIVAFFFVRLVFLIFIFVPTVIVIPWARCHQSLN